MFTRTLLRFVIKIISVYVVLWAIFYASEHTTGILYIYACVFDRPYIQQIIILLPSNVRHTKIQTKWSNQTNNKHLFVYVRVMFFFSWVNHISSLFVVSFVVCTSNVHKLWSFEALYLSRFIYKLHVRFAFFSYCFPLFDSLSLFLTLYISQLQLVWNISIVGWIINVIPRKYDQLLYGKRRAFGLI